MTYKLSLKALVLAAAAGVLGGWLSNSIPLGVVIFLGILLPSWSGVYQEYRKDNPQGLWFKRKLFGWGWTPVKWQGWLTIVVYAGLLTAIFVHIDRRSHSVSDLLFGILVPFVLLTIALIWICIEKGETPRWQWGSDTRRD